MLSQNVTRKGSVMWPKRCAEHHFTDNKTDFFFPHGGKFRETYCIFYYIYFQRSQTQPLIAF